MPWFVNVKALTILRELGLWNTNWECIDRANSVLKRACEHFASESAWPTSQVLESGIQNIEDTCYVRPNTAGCNSELKGEILSRWIFAKPLERQQQHVAWRQLLLASTRWHFQLPSTNTLQVTNLIKTESCLVPYTLGAPFR